MARLNAFVDIIYYWGGIRNLIFTAGGTGTDKTRIDSTLFDLFFVEFDFFFVPLSKFDLFFVEILDFTFVYYIILYCDIYS